MNQLQTVLDALSDERYVTRYSQIEEAIAIVRGMMQAEPVAWIGHRNGIRHMTSQRQIAEAEPETYDTPLYAAPAAPQAVPAVRQPVFTTGHCKEKAKPGGCQLHNLKCSYPACDRMLTAAPAVEDKA